jgi:hypothetical protein
MAELKTQKTEASVEEARQTLHRQGLLIHQEIERRGYQGVEGADQRISADRQKVRQMTLKKTRTTTRKNTW